MNIEAHEFYMIIYFGYLSLGILLLSLVLVDWALKFIFVSFVSFIFREKEIKTKSPLLTEIPLFSLYCLYFGWLSGERGIQSYQSFLCDFYKAKDPRDWDDEGGVGNLATKVVLGVGFLLNFLISLLVVSIVYFFSALLFVFSIIVIAIIFTLAFRKIIDSINKH